jgi:hypothetical protein
MFRCISALPDHHRLTPSWGIATVKPVTDRSGCSSAELAVLLAADRCTTRNLDEPDEYVVCTRALALTEALTGLGPRHSWELLLDLARRWVIAVPLIDTQGNIGSHTWPTESPGPRYVECRVSRAGRAVLDAEAHDIAPVPAGLINGTAWRGGIQPPLDPLGVIAALRHLLDHPDASDDDVLAITGPPWSLTGCEVSGDLDALAAGEQIMLRQTGRIRLTGNPIPERHVPDPAKGSQLIIESLPPNSSDVEVCQHLDSIRRQNSHRPPEGLDARPARLPIADLADLGNDYHPIRIAITLAPGSDPAAVREQLSALDGITTEAPAAYPAPLATLLRAWAKQHGSEDIAGSLTRFEDAIRHDRREDDRG